MQSQEIYPIHRIISDITIQIDPTQNPDRIRRSPHPGTRIILPEVEGVQAALGVNASAGEGVGVVEDILRVLFTGQRPGELAEGVVLIPIGNAAVIGGKSGDTAYWKETRTPSLSLVVTIAASRLLAS